MRSRQEIPMTEGPIWKRLLVFSVPLIIGNLFQQLYNTVDTFIVGNYVGSVALAAVGCTGSIINTVIFFATGLTTGASVVISQYFGARNPQKLRLSVHTTMLMILIVSVLLTAVSVPLVPFMLRAMSTTADVIPAASEYLRIYFAGLIGMLVYNAGSAILRAVGDSRRPLYFLVISALINVALDLVFVLCFDLGVAGVAYATIISQGVSAVMVMFVLMRSHTDYQVRVRELKMDPPTLRLIVKIGFPTVVQQVLTSFSNVFVQGYVNRFGTACMAGWAAYGKVDAFALLPLGALSMASTTFVGQNVGADLIDRAKKGISTAMKLTLIITAFFIAVMMIFARPLVSIFAREEDVIEYGVKFILMISPFYLLCCVNQILAGALRGAGDTRAPMLLLLASFVVFRQIYLYITDHFSGALEWVALGYPAGWVMCSLLLYIYYKKSDWVSRARTAVTGKNAA